MNVSIITLGCRVNQSESNDIEASLKENGVTIVNLKDKPDYCIINTCSVTCRGEVSSRQEIRKASKTGAKVIVTGCYAQLKPEEMTRISSDCRVVSIKSKRDIITIVTGESPDTFHATYSNSRPYLKVQDGCNLKCSYCIVPLARGRSRSLSTEDVLERAKLIEKKGYSEVVLTGIHLGAYGHDLGTNTNLYSLISELLKQTGIARFRISSIEINEIDSDLIDLLGEKRICKHIHLPMQSGSNRILKTMNRPYTFDQYRQVVKEIAEHVENIAIGTDVIVGFPGEDEDDFLNTCDAIESLPFAYVHIFPYSPRPNTRAFDMHNRVKDSVVKKRVSILKDLDNRKRKAYQEKQKHRVLEVIVEDKHNDVYTIGTASNYVKVLFRSVSAKKGSLVNVRPVSEIKGLIEAILVVS